MKKLSTVSVFALAFSFAAVLGITTTSSPADAANPDKVYVTTLNVAANHTDCTNNNFGYSFDDRMSVVRGRHSKVRISRHLSDVNLERASITSCSGECSATITRKGNAEGKGFVELDLNIPTDAPSGNATLVLHYALGAKGEYKLLIVKNSRVDAVERSTVGASAERYILRGNNLDQITNRFSATRSGASGFSLSRVSEADATLVLDRNEKSCTAGTFDLDLTIESAPSCRINNVGLPATRDASCTSNSTTAPPINGGVSGGGGGASTVQPATPNLLPALVTPVVTARALGPAQATTRGQVFPVAPFFCANLQADTAATVALPTMKWGVSGVNIAQATQRFDVQLLNGDTGAVIDTLTLAQGFPANTPLVQKDNYAGRPTSLRVIKDPRFQVGSAIQTKIGCFTEPGTTPAFEAKSLKIKVDATNQINEGSRENDNELSF